MKPQPRPAVSFILFPDQEYFGKIIDYFLKTNGKYSIEVLRDRIDAYKEKIRQFMLQPITEDMFVRPEKPKLVYSEGIYGSRNQQWSDILTKIQERHDSEISIKEWQNWQPLFVDADYSTEITDWLSYKYRFTDKLSTLETFILEKTAAYNKGFSRFQLHWNPEHKNKLFYVDIK